jgi:hypothetical protein
MACCSGEGAPEHVDAVVRGDGEEPGAKRAARVVAAERLLHAEEGLARRVFGGGVVTEDAAAEAPDDRPVRAEELRMRFRVPGAGPLDAGSISPLAHARCLPRRG